MAEIISAILTKIAASVLVSGARAGYSKLTEATPFAKAIDATQAAFSGTETKSALLKWCESDSFRATLTDIQNGKDALLDAAIIRSFINIGEFYDGESTDGKATLVLQYFLKALEQELFRSKDGLAIIANRQETLAEQAQQTTIEARNLIMEAGEQRHQVLLTALEALSDRSGEDAVREKVYHDRLEQARKLLESGKPKTARRMLEDLRSEVSKQNPSKALLFRIATSIGSCAVQSDDQETAIREIDFAFQLDPEHPTAITNLAAATLLKGQPQKALELAERARQLTPQNSVATANFFQALFALGRESEVEQLVGREVWIVNDSNCCFAIGTSFFNKGRFAEAENFFRLGLAANPTEPRLLVNLAHSVVRPIQQALLGQPLLDWKFPPEAKLKFKEAELLLGQAIAAQEDFEDRRFLAFAHVLRADVRRMLGDEPGAMADCEVALHENPREEGALPIKALAQMHAGQFDEAIKTFERVENADAKQRILIPLATLYNAREKPGQVVELLTPFWGDSQTGLDQIKIAGQLLWAYSQLHNTAEADTIICKLETAWAKNPEALSAIAGYRRQQGRTDEAIGLFTEALAYACGSAKDFIALQLGDIFYGRDEFAKAAELYESIADLTTANDLSTRYLVCLYNSGPHKDALNLAKLLRGDGEPVPVISQIEANILAEIGDIKAAQVIMEQLSELRPKVFAYRLAAAEFAMRRGLHENARSLLEQIPYEQISTDGKVLARVARLRAVLGMGDVLKFLYQARRVAFNSPQIHAMYVALFVSRAQVDHVDVIKETVDDDCAVALKIGNEKRAYTILRDGDLHPGRNEISPEQAGTMHLLGRKKGDTFTIQKDAFGADIECLVIDVQSKYVRAFQETLEQFPALFPTDLTLQGVQGPYEKFRDGLLKQLDEHQNEILKITKIYEARQITFEALAGVLHCSTVELWGTLTGGRYCSFANFSGTAEDAQAEAAAASQAEAVLLEFTAILTFAQLGLLERLEKRYKLFATQPVFDALAEAYAEVATSVPGLSVGKVGDTYIREDTTAAKLEAQRGFLKSILEFLANHVTTLSVPSLLEKDPVSDDLRDFLGPISTSSLFAARTEKLPLYSDDQMLRALARNEWQIGGMSAQPVLHELAAKNILTKEECMTAVARLFFMNFNFVLMGADNLMWVLERVQYRTTEEVIKVLSLFHGPQCTFESAVEVLAETAKRLWLEGPLYHYKVDLLYAILDALGTNRATNQVAQHFTQAIILKLFLAPNAADTVGEHVRLWKERKLGRAGIIIPPRR